MKGLIICDDKRYDFLKVYLEDRGINFVSTYDELGLDVIIFPFKEKIDTVIFNDDFFKRLKKDILIFSGVENDYINEMTEKYGLKYCPLMSINSIKILNSIPTSEGVIYFILKNFNKTIFNSSSLVVGYGKCGKSISDRLVALGSNVSVIVNSDESKSQAISNKLDVININNIYKNKYDFIINTVPKHIINEESIKGIDNTVLIIDIASEPYGFSKELMIDKNYFQIGGIPGRVCPETAGNILGEYIFWRILK